MRFHGFVFEKFYQQIFQIHAQHNEASGIIDGILMRYIAKVHAD